MGAVAFGVFDFRVKLGGGATVFGQIEMRVVAEAVCACSFCLPLSAPDAFGDNGLWVVFVADEDEDADVVATFVVFIGKIGREFGVVCGIGFGVFRPHNVRKKMPGAPFKALVQIPESSASAGKPLYLAALRALARAFSTKVWYGSGHSGVLNCDCGRTSMFKLAKRRENSLSLPALPLARTIFSNMVFP